MPHLILTAAFGRGITRCGDFLAKRDEAAAARARGAIERHIRRLTVNPGVGRPYRPDPLYRELVIPFGDSGYVALYRHDVERDAVHLLAFRHQGEADYRD